MIAGDRAGVRSAGMRMGKRAHAVVGREGASAGEWAAVVWVEVVRGDAEVGCGGCLRMEDGQQSAA